MIFATVGTHEDPFDRLLGALDGLGPEFAPPDEEIVVQSGYCTLQPRRVRAEPLIAFSAVQALMAEARIVITHGGPASIMQALAHGKVPIVVPRQARFGEHVDDHQVRFAARIADRVLVVLDIADLGPAIRDHAVRVASLTGGTSGPERARAFAERFDALCSEVVAGRAIVARR